MGFLTDQLPKLLSATVKGEDYIVDGWRFFETLGDGAGEAFLVTLEELANLAQLLDRARFEYWDELGTFLGDEVDQARKKIAWRHESRDLIDKAREEMARCGR